MNLFCSNCGKEISENEKFCSSCGAPVKSVNPEPTSVEPVVETPVQNTVYAGPVKQKIKGNGMSIAGMVLGIIATTWLLMSLLSIGNIEPLLAELRYQYGELFGSALIGFAIGYTLFSLIPSLVGLPLSIVGFVKHKSGKNITGLILNSITLAACIVIVIYIMSFS